MDDHLISVTRQAWANARPEIERQFERLWSTPELGMMEFEACRGFGDWLKAAGFAVEPGAYGLPTAFVARHQRGTGPQIALLAEYDALPGQGNAAVAHRQTAAGAAGHACGHNQIGPANIGAAIAARQAMEDLGLEGTLTVIGCPAEEIVWGKIALLKAGAFDGLNAILTSHGDYQNGAISRPCQSCIGAEFVFHGVAGHAGAVRKQNALETAELAVQSFERLRAHHFPDVSVEHVLRVGGLMPNITPSEARLWICVRHVDYERAEEIYDYLVRLCRNAAEITQTRFVEQFIAGTRGYLPNDTLAERLYRNLEIVGPPRWDEAGLQWMSELSESCQPGADFDLDRALGLYREGVDPYGQDDGEASWYVPLARANWAIPLAVPLHSWAATALTGHPAGYPGPLMASEALALTAVELLAEPGIAADAERELQERRAGKALSSPRLGAYEVMTKDPARFWDGTWVAEPAAE